MKYFRYIVIFTGIAGILIVSGCGGSVHQASSKDIAQIQSLPRIDAYYEISGAETEIGPPEIDFKDNGILVISWQTRDPVIDSGLQLGVILSNECMERPYFNTTVAVDTTGRMHSVVITLDEYLRTIKGISFSGLIAFQYYAVSKDTCRSIQSPVYRLGFLREKLPQQDGMIYIRRPVISEGPLVCNVTATNAVLFWRTDMVTTGALQVGERLFDDTVLTNQHSVMLNGLKPETEYVYCIRSRSDAETMVHEIWYHFKTPPYEGKRSSFSFAVCSDSEVGLYRSGSLGNVNHTSVLTSLMNDAMNRNAALVLFPGNMIIGNTSLSEQVLMEYRMWKQKIQGAWHFIPFYSGMGNNEARVYEEQVITYNRFTLPQGGYEERRDYTLHFPRHDRMTPEQLFSSEFVNPGNGPDTEEQFKDHPFYENTYSFNYGDSHFIMLNNNWCTVSDPSGSPLTEFGFQGMFPDAVMQWLEEDLAYAQMKGIKHIFVFYSEPAFPNAGQVSAGMYYDGTMSFGKNSNSFPTDSQTYRELRNTFWKLLCENSVCMAFSGHEHCYHRTLIDAELFSPFYHSITQLVVGTAGAPFESMRNYTRRGLKIPWQHVGSGVYEKSKVEFFSINRGYALIHVDGNRVSGEYINQDGQVIDTFKIK